jgi:hypothetical protein
LTNVPPSTVSYLDNYAFLADTTYSYRIQSVDGSTTANSSTATIMLSPNAPSGLTAGSYTSSSIDLSWTNNSSIATGYTFENSPDDSTWTTAGTASSSPDTLSGSWSEGEVVYLRVAATTTDTVSGYSPSVDVTMPPATPTDLGAMYNSAGNLIISWQNNSAHDDAYTLNWSSSYFSGTVHHVSLGPDTTVGDMMNYPSLSPTTTPEGQTYSVSVQCSENGVSSGVDGSITIQSAPYAPSDLTGGDDPFYLPSLVVTVTWTNNSTVATDVTIYQSLVGPTDFSNPLTTIAASPGAGTYTDTSNTYTSGQTVYYMVRALYEGTYYSAAASVTITT